MKIIPPLPFRSKFSIINVTSIIASILFLIITPTLYSYNNHNSHKNFLQSVVIAESPTQIKIQWTDTFLNEDGFEIFRRSGRFGRFHKIHTTEPDVTSWIDTSVYPNTLYIYYIKPMVSGRIYCPTEFTITPGQPEIVPVAPENLSALAASPSLVILSWTDSSDNEYGFRIERKMIDGEFRIVTTVGAHATSIIDSSQSLVSNTEYVYRVIAFNPVGDSGPSNEVKVRIKGEPIESPLSPGNLICIPLSCSMIALEWTDNGCNEELFIIERKRSKDNNFSIIKELGANAQNFIDTGLQDHTTYTYRVRTFNRIGFSGYTQEVDVETLSIQSHTPQAPLYVIADAVSAIQVDLSWIDNSDNEFGFIIQRKEKINKTRNRCGGNYNLWDYFYKNVAIVYNSTTWSDRNVKPGTMYEYRVSSFNNKKQSQSYHDISVLTPDIPVTLPVIPAYLTGSALAAHKIDLEWKDNSMDEYGFVIERMIPGEAFYPITTLPPNTTEWSDKNVCSSSYYIYRIMAFNSVGSSIPSHEIIVYPFSHPINLPVAPSLLGIMPLSATQMQLSWADNSPCENGFVIERRTEDSGYQIVANLSHNNPSSVLEFRDADLLPGTVYYYRVYAYNINGQSGYSNESYNSTFTYPQTKPLRPEIISGATLAPHYIVLTWIDNAYNEEGFIIQKKGGNNSWNNCYVAGVDVVEWIDKEVTKDTLSMYRIAAYNLHGQSSWSTPFSVLSVITPISSSLSSIIITPEILDANGVDVAEVMVTVNDTDSNPVSGAVVFIQATGSGTIITQPESPTNTEGRAAGTIASTTAGEMILTIIVNPGEEELVLDEKPIVTFEYIPQVRLVYTVQPSHTASGESISPAVEVELQDALGNCMNSATTSVTLALGLNPSNTILYGTTTAQAVNGKVSFADLYIDTYDENYSLVASSDGLDSVESDRFTILPLELNVGNNGFGSTVPQGPIMVNYQEEIFLTAVAQEGYHFVEWSVVAGTVIIDDPDSATTTVIMNHGNSVIQAVFEINVYSISSICGPDGSITPSGEVFVPYGGSQLFIITPDDHYHIQEVFVDGNFVGPVTEYEFARVTSSHTIYAEFAIDTFVISAHSGENGSISPTGESVVPYGGSLLFTISPDNNYHIQDVCVDGVSVGIVPEYELNQVTSSHTIYAEFAIDTFVITTQSGENGSITPTGESVVPYDGSLLYTITPDDHYHIQDVLIDGISVGPVTAYEFTQVISNHTIHAEFAIDTYVISTNSGENGSISPAGDSVVPFGGSLLYTITPDDHYHIQDVIIDGISVGVVSTYEFTQVTSSHTIHAEFAINTYNLRATTEGHGTITPDGTVTVNSGSNVKFLIVPTSGYKILDVIVDGISVGPVKSYVFANITDPHTIHAVFP